MYTSPRRRGTLPALIVMIFALSFFFTTASADHRPGHPQPPGCEKRSETGRERSVNCRTTTTTTLPPTTTTTLPTSTTTTLPPAACGVATQSGGEGVTRTTHELGSTSGTFRFTYAAYSIPDQFDIYYEGTLIYTTGGPVSGFGDVMVSYGPGTSTVIEVVVTGPSGTVWDYTVYCPA